jgi:S1-C subfamily serine protease
MKRIYLFLLLGAFLLFGGCTLQYPIVGISDAYNEVLSGTVTSNLWTGQGTIEGTSVVLHVRCSGTAATTYVPYGGGVAGQKGIGAITCDDGRQIQAIYTITGVPTGFGVGKDQYGNTYTFSFGMSEFEAAAKVDEYVKSAATRPSLPTSKVTKNQREGVSKDAETIAQRTGTGFFVSNNGYLVTNYHVVESTKEVLVILQDGGRLPARVLRSDPANDLALLKIDVATTGLSIRSTETLAVGEDVFTVGYPLPNLQGQDQKATFGRVNSLTGLLGDVRFIQIDVPIQPGNSGGPLIDSSGRVVGIVTARLDELATLQASGALPQNVNYATKSDYLIPFLRSSIASEWKPADPAGQNRNIPDLVKTVQTSVALVVGK